MSEPSTLRLSVQFLSNVIDVKYGSFDLTFFKNHLQQERIAQKL